MGNTNQTELFKIAAYQGPICEGNLSQNLVTVLECLREAENDQVDILCMPECFLHGYFATREEALQYSIDLKSAEFSELLDPFKPFHYTTTLIGLNERVGELLYNTVIVIEAGKLMGKYRKAYTYAPYDYYELGVDFPVFEKRGVPFSIIICYDCLFREPALISALKGAKILFCPMFNRVEKTEKSASFLESNAHFITRAFDTNCWLVCSDIVWESDTHTCPGYATILCGEGRVVVASEPFKTRLLTYAIPMEGLLKPKKKRFFGNRTLTELLCDTLR